MVARWGFYIQCLYETWIKCNCGEVREFFSSRLIHQYFSLVNVILSLVVLSQEALLFTMRDQPSQNSSSNEDPLGRKHIEVVLETFFAVVIFVSSILSNSIVLYVIRTNSNLKTFINKIIGNLCIVDLVETFLIMPLWITSLVKGSWVFGTAICSVSGFLFVAVANAILFSLMLIAVSRYFKVVKPQLYNSIFVTNKYKSTLLLALCWILPAITSSPPLYGWGRYKFHPYSCLCAYEWSFDALNSTYMLFLLVTQPSPYIICWCYYKIYNTVRKNRIQICTRANRAACQNAHNAENMCIHTTLGIGCVIVLCWFPKAILVIIMAAGKQGLDLPLMISSYLVFLSCCLNPVVYGMLNPQFKPAFKALFKRREVENPRNAWFTVSELDYRSKITKN